MLFSKNGISKQKKKKGCKKVKTTSGGNCLPHPLKVANVVVHNERWTVVMAPFHALVLVVHQGYLGDVLRLAGSPIDWTTPGASPAPLPRRVRGRLALLGRPHRLGRSHGHGLLNWGSLGGRVLTTTAITKGGPLVRGRDLLRRWRLVLFEDEAGSLADVVDLSALCRGASPTVVDSSRILDLR